jgi:hypothetical protein
MNNTYNNIMFIEKYTAQIKDNTTKKTFKLTIDENTPEEAHKKIFNRLSFYQDILKIEDFEKNVVFDLDKGFL